MCIEIEPLFICISINIFTMYLQTILCLLPLLNLLQPAAGKPVSNVAVIGSVFCDSCSENTYSNRSYFLKGAKVRVKCKFGKTSAAENRTTDRYGVYQLDISLTGGYECPTARKMKSACRATLIQTPPSPCDRAGIWISAVHVAVEPRGSNTCILNMNALTVRPSTRDAAGFCTNRPQSGTLGSSLFFFWPIFPPLGLPWLHWPPLPLTFPPLPFPFNTIPLPDPASLPFLLPPWLLPFLDPASLPFPFSLIPPLIPIPTLSTPPPAPLSHIEP